MTSSATHLGIQVAGPYPVINKWSLCLLFPIVPSTREMQKWEGLVRNEPGEGGGVLRREALILQH